MYLLQTEYYSTTAMTSASMGHIFIRYAHDWSRVVVFKQNKMKNLSLNTHFSMHPRIVFPYMCIIFLTKTNVDASMNYFFSKNKK